MADSGLSEVNSGWHRLIRSLVTGMADSGLTEADSSQLDASLGYLEVSSGSANSGQLADGRMEFLPCVLHNRASNPIGSAAI